MQTSAGRRECRVRGSRAPEAGAGVGRVVVGRQEVGMPFIPHDAHSDQIGRIVRRDARRIKEDQGGRRARAGRRMANCLSRQMFWSCQRPAHRAKHRQTAAHTPPPPRMVVGISPLQTTQDFSAPRPSQHAPQKAQNKVAMAVPPSLDAVHWLGASRSPLHASETTSGVPIGRRIGSRFGLA